MGKNTPDMFSASKNMKSRKHKIIPPHFRFWHPPLKKLSSRLRICGKKIPQNFKLMYLHEFLELGAQILGDFYLGCNSSISGVFCDRTHLGRSREGVPTALFFVSKMI